MAGWKPTYSVRGAIHDVARLKEMSGTCNVVVVSDATLNIIQNYAIDEIAFLSRFGVEFDGGYYVPVDKEHSDYEFVLDTIRQYRLEVNDMTCDLVSALQGVSVSIDNAAATMAACCDKMAERSSQDQDDIPHDGEISVGQPGDQFPDQTSYFNAKCSAANAIYDTVHDYTWELGEQIDTIGLGVGITSGLVAIATIAGPASWAIFGVSSVLVAVAYHVISFSLSYADMRNALEDVHEEIVLALYNASDTETARAGFMTELEAATPTLTSAEYALIRIMLADKFLNQLFVPREDTAVYVSPDPVTCGGWAHTFDFTISAQGWTNDASHSRPFGTYSAGVGWVSVWGSVGGFDERLYLERTGAGGENIQSVTVTYDFVGTCGSGRKTGIILWNVAVQQGVSEVVPDCGPFVHQGIFSDIGTIITTSAVGDALSDGALEITITEIIVTGSGSDPF